MILVLSGFDEVPKNHIDKEPPPVTVFDQKNFYFELAQQKLFKTLNDRDAIAMFSLQTFREFAQNYLFKNIFELEVNQLTVLQNYYNVARGSLDFPFTLSLAHHGYVVPSVLRKMASPRFTHRFQQDIESAEKIMAFHLFDQDDLLNSKRTRPQLIETETGAKIVFHKSFVVNGAAADNLFSLVWNQNHIETYIFEKSEFHQSSIANHLSGFRSGDVGSLVGQLASAEVFDRRLSTHHESLKVVKYTSAVERLIIAVIAAGVCHGVEDFLTKQVPASLVETMGRKRQLIESVNKLQVVRFQIISMIASILQKGEDHWTDCEVEFSALRQLICKEAREHIFSCGEALGFMAFHNSYALQKIIRDFNMTSLLGFKVPNDSQKLEVGQTSTTTKAVPATNRPPVAPPEIIKQLK